MATWTCSCAPYPSPLPLLPRARQKRWLHSVPPHYTRIHKHQREVLRVAATDTDIAYAPPRGLNRDNSISGPKKTKEVESVIHGGKIDGERKSKEKEFVLSDNKRDAEIEEFLEIDLQMEDNDIGNGNNFANSWPPLVCCFGAAQNKFTPILARYADIPLTAKSLQGTLADLIRSRGGSPSNVAIELARSGGRVALMGKVGNDAYGRQIIITLNMNNIQTRGVHVDPSSSTSVSYMKLNQRDGKLGMTCIKPCAEDSLLSPEINVDILREARMFHFTSMALLTKSLQSTLLAAIRFSEKCGGVIFFDVNLPLLLWRRRTETWEIIQQAWEHSNVIELSKQELEFLLGKDYVKKKRAVKNRYLHYHGPTREELSSLWHDDLKVLFVNYGAKIYYYTPSFEGSVPGTEDMFLTRFSYDRSASSDAFIAEIIRRLVMEPELYTHQLQFDQAIRYAITASTVAPGVISHTRQYYATDSQEYINGEEGLDKFVVASF